MPRLSATMTNMPSMSGTVGSITSYLDAQTKRTVTAKKAILLFRADKTLKSTTVVAMASELLLSVDLLLLHASVLVFSLYRMLTLLAGWLACLVADLLTCCLTCLFACSYDC